jgi:hypothetical protein
MNTPHLGGDVEGATNNPEKKIGTNTTINQRRRKNIQSTELWFSDRWVFGMFFCLLLMTRNVVHAGSCAGNEEPSCELEKNTPAMCTLKSPSSCHGTYQYMVKKEGAANPFNGVTFNPGTKAGEGTAPRAVDINNDGLMDIFVGMGSGQIEYWKNTGSTSVPSFTKQIGSNNPFDNVVIPHKSSPYHTASGRQGFATLCPVDLNGDASIDMLIGSRDYGILYYKNTGTPTAPVFVKQTGAANPFDTHNDMLIGGSSIVLGHGHAIPSTVDLDNDGDNDVFVWNSHALYYFKNIGTKTNAVFELQTGTDNPLHGQTAGAPGTIAVIDRDNDGLMDLYVGDVSGKILYYRNTGSRTNPAFTRQVGEHNPFNTFNAGPDAGYGRASPTVIGQDVYLGTNNGKIMYFQNSETPSRPVYHLQHGMNNPLSGVDVGDKAVLCLVDMDDDGDEDLFVGNGDGMIYYFLNDGDSTGPVFVEQTGANNPLNGVDVGDDAYPIAYDVDGDLDFDLYIGKRRNAVVIVLFFEWLEHLLNLFNRQTSVLFICRKLRRQN